MRKLNHEEMVINIFCNLLPNMTYVDTDQAYNEIINKIQELQAINILYNKKIEQER